MNSRQAGNVISGAFRREYERRTPDAPPLDPNIAAAAMRKLIDDGVIRPSVTMAEMEAELTGPVEVPVQGSRRGWGVGWRG